MKYMLSHQKALKLRMGIMLGNLKNLYYVKTEKSNLGEKNIPYLFNYTKFHAVTCGILYVHSKYPQSNIHHFIVGRLYIYIYIYIY